MQTDLVHTRNKHRLHRNYKYESKLGIQYERLKLEDLYLAEI